MQFSFSAAIDTFLCLWLRFIVRLLEVTPGTWFNLIKISLQRGTVCFFLSLLKRACCCLYSCLCNYPCISILGLSVIMIGCYCEPTIKLCSLSFNNILLRYKEAVFLMHGNTHTRRYRLWFMVALFYWFLSCYCKSPREFDEGIQAQNIILTL